MSKWITIEEAKKSAPVAPPILQHCALAVRKKGKSSSEAWAICRAQLTKQGYLKGPYRSKGKIVHLTTKGIRSSIRHQREPDHKPKRRAFSREFKGVG